MLNASWFPFFLKSRWMRERLEVILAVFCPIKQDGSISERLKDFEAKVVFSLFLLMRTERGRGAEEDLGGNVFEGLQY